MSAPHPQPSNLQGLPSEFTLQLGSHSTSQVEAMARVLKALGAAVEIDPTGSLRALRPEA